METSKGPVIVFTVCHPRDKEASFVSLFDLPVPFLREVDILLLVLKPSPALPTCLSPHFLVCQTLTFGGKTTDLI